MMRRSVAAFAVLIGAVVTGACAAREPADVEPPRPRAEADPPPARQVMSVTERVPVQMVRDAGALADFRANRELTTEGGECGTFDRAGDGMSAVTLHFPSRHAPQSAITLMFRDDGTLVRYIENRGFATPGADRAAMQQEMARIPRTLVQLDYVTGLAIVMNSGAFEENRVLQGRVADFERSEALGDLVARREMVIGRCGRGG